MYMYNFRNRGMRQMVSMTWTLEMMFLNFTNSTNTNNSSVPLDLKYFQFTEK